MTLVEYLRNSGNKNDMVEVLQILTEEIWDGKANIVSEFFSKYFQDKEIKEFEGYKYEVTNDAVNNYNRANQSMLKIYKDGWEVFFYINFSNKHCQTLDWSFQFAIKEKDKWKYVKDSFKGLEEGDKTKGWTFDKGYFYNNSLNGYLVDMIFNPDRLYEKIVEKFVEVKNRFENDYGASFEDINDEVKKFNANGS